MQNPHTLLQEVYRDVRPPSQPERIWSAVTLLQLHNPVQLRYLGESLSSNSDQHTLLLLLQIIRYNTAAIAELAVIMPGSRPTDNTHAGPQ